MAKLFKKLVPDHQVIVFREGKQVSALPGKAFEFTAEEVLQILKNQPGSLRSPVNESSDGDVSGDADEATLLREAQDQAAAERKLAEDAEAEINSRRLPSPNKGGKGKGDEEI